MTFLSYRTPGHTTLRQSTTHWLVARREIRVQVTSLQYACDAIYRNPYRMALAAGSREGASVVPSEGSDAALAAAAAAAGAAGTQG